ncbi:MAG: phosphonate transport system permease protein [Betaproteobacteria bacterium]|jgi:phosphonate transport system permease protein
MNAPIVSREWRPHTSAQRLARFALYFGIVAACVFSLRTVQIIPEFLYDAPEQVADLFKRMWPIEWSYYPGGVHDALIETLHIATLGTILAIAMAVPLGVLAAHNIVPSTAINYAAKFLLVSSRSVNSLVWALLFVAIFGPGALAGTMAIAFRSIGFVGKLFGEALEETRPGPIEALKAAGAPPASIFLKGYWPQVVPAFWAIALFRWDISVRESAVLGLVGAGGIGMAIDSAMNLFQWERVALMLVAIFAVVLIAELAVTFIRKRII